MADPVNLDHIRLARENAEDMARWRPAEGWHVHIKYADGSFDFTTVDDFDEIGPYLEREGAGREVAYIKIDPNT